MNTIYGILGAILPLEAYQFTFMKNAFLAILLLTPLLGLLGTMAVNHQMAFFSDALAHSALTGIVLGIILGLRNDLAAMLIFGIICWRSNPTKNMHHSGTNKGTFVHNGVTAFLVTFSNPLIIFLFMGLFAQFAFVIPDHPFEMLIGYISIVAGALIWWFGLTWLVDKIRNIFDESGILIINRVIGSAVILFSLIVLFGTVFNLYTFNY